MIRKIWEEDFFSEGQHTSWTCPRCFTGSLFAKTTPTIIPNDHYTAVLRCSNSHCKEELGSMGRVRYFSFMDKMEVSKMFYGRKYKQFYPSFFLPTLKMFELNDTVPKDVRENINLSFNTFWSDRLSAANSIRRALEALIEPLQMPQEMSLHERILAYMAKDPEVANWLLAIKWIGNSGSHGELLTRADLLDAYIILEQTLKKLFPIENTEDVGKLAAQINLLKGGRSKECP